MAADDPIRIGAAAFNALIAESGSHISTDDYGVQHGTIRYFLGDQSLSQSARFALGASYSGSLTQYNGFVVEKSGDITGIDGKCANLDVQYARIDPLWVNVPTRTHDLQLVNLRPGDLGDGFGQLYDTMVQVLVPIAHPVITYKYATNVYPFSLGTYGTPSQAPTIVPFLFRVQSHDFSNAQLNIQQKTVSVNGVVYTIDPVTGNCSTSHFTVPITMTGIFSQDTLQTINPLNLNFVPDPLGWLCLKEDVIPTSAASFWLVQQQWKRSYIFNGTQPGTWWNGSHQVHCPP